MSPSQDSKLVQSREADAVVIGAGFAGLYMVHKLKEMGLSHRAFEQGGGVGGTWYWNRYPGASSDSESWVYSYTFSEELEQEWNGSCRFPEQAEILRYLEHVANRFDLKSSFVSTRGSPAPATTSRVASGWWKRVAASSSGPGF